MACSHARLSPLKASRWGGRITCGSGKATRRSFKVGWHCSQSTQRGHTQRGYQLPNSCVLPVVGLHLDQDASACAYGEAYVVYAWDTDMTYEIILT